MHVIEWIRVIEELNTKARHNCLETNEGKTKYTIGGKENKATVIKIRIESKSWTTNEWILSRLQERRATTDQIFIMKEVIATCYEYKIAAEIIFIDFRKACYSINRDKLMKTKLIKLIQMA